MRRFCLVLSVLLLLSALAGCSLEDIIKTDNPPTLPKVDLDSSTITGTVEYVNGYTIRIVVSQGDSHFDGPYINSKNQPVPGDTLQVTYTSLGEAKSVSVGDSVTVTYRYTQDVSEKNGIPHITVNILTVNPPAA